MSNFSLNGLVAQWQSVGLAIARSRVRLPVESPSSDCYLDGWPVRRLVNHIGIQPSTNTKLNSSLPSLRGKQIDHLWLGVMARLIHLCQVSLSNPIWQVMLRSLVMSYRYRHKLCSRRLCRAENSHRDWALMRQVFARRTDRWLMTDHVHAVLWKEYQSVIACHKARLPPKAKHATHLRIFR